jgi:putative transcriptional regulator
MEKFSTTLKELRGRHNLTQEDLADEVGVVRQTITYLERGDYMPSLGLAQKIARRFNLPIEKVFIFDISKNNQS